METLIIQPKDKAELNFFLELAKRLGAKAATFESDADERLLQSMEKNKKTHKVSRQEVFDTIHEIIKE
ncbi:MAG: hypothetical protein D4R64_15485 [Porphyromonadaceae bacterium]|nr:MAG: hypothetical protein D4R64_15485 [Porphyromonadaceae bacterium]